jgi:hypothetical protein
MPWRSLGDGREDLMSDHVLPLKRDAWSADSL